ncbi:MAG: FG-GAP repeat protein [Candidatus Magasanikbacteria bacterium]|nr:FG-GAP repeat protein [Candidatus Magasanikbacteria bacterium]
MKKRLAKKTSLRFFLAGVFFVLSFFYYSPVEAAPFLANYYLAELKDDSGFISQISRYDLLILTPDQINLHPTAIKQIRQKNSDIIILAYVPSQSFNTKYWDKPYSLFKNLRPIADSWWLKDPQGKIISHWPDLADINMDPAWSRRLVDFTRNYILNSEEVDGVFFDMVSEGISWVNGGNIDLNGDGQKDSAAWLDAEWLSRTEYLLDYARVNLKTKYIVINGSSSPLLQSAVNGRMFETFPLRWDNSGEWGKIMRSWKANKSSNKQPLLTIINTNTANAGGSDNYRQMRYGLASALLEDGYFSYDYGDKDHGQLWWYDEYGVSLGKPISPASSKKQLNEYQADVWRRDFKNGLAIVNSTAGKEVVDLGGEYEKIHGTQDAVVNDGSIVTEVTIDEYDGRVLLKTFSSVDDVLFRNGDFLRFFDSAGNRVRNGFFVFEDGYKGGDKIAHIDLDGNGKRDLLVVHNNRIMAWRDDGQIYMRVYPYTINYAGELRVAIGDLNGDGFKEVYVAPSDGYPAPIKIYTRHGRKMKQDWYPFGVNYSGGYSLAVANTDGGKKSELLIGAGKNVEPKVYFYNYQFYPLASWLAFEKSFRGGVNVTGGDVNGDGKDEVIVGAGEGKMPIIKVFSADGKQIGSEFFAYQTFTAPGVEVLSADVDFDGKDDVVAMSGGF